MPEEAWMEYRAAAAECEAWFARFPRYRHRFGLLNAFEIRDIIRGLPA
jgi:hypothetical protein